MNKQATGLTRMQVPIRKQAGTANFGACMLVKTLEFDGIKSVELRRIDSVSKTADLCGSPNQRRNGQDLEVITPGPGAESEGVQTQAAIRINPCWPDKPTTPVNFR